MDVPDVVAVGPRVLITEWLDSAGSLATIIANGTQAERDHYGEIFTRFLFSGPARTGLLHADPHPGNFRVIPNDDGSPGRIGVLDYGAVARLPQRGLPEPMGRLITLCAAGDGDALIEGLREEGFLKDRIRIEPQPAHGLPLAVRRSHAGRALPVQPGVDARAVPADQQPEGPGVHGEHQGSTCRRRTSSSTAPGSVASACSARLEAEAPFRALLQEFLPGFTPA
ncbi:AarF/UbiB family protein [Nocardioides convexus]|uniref:AarF/UbiB family protein n=1 Tax=Nocardioides convexus TaxID=2712224 RepID=UPI0024186457|nr:AarF/UbiB family protein [Nocardioides convexus]